MTQSRQPFGFNSENVTITLVLVDRSVEPVAAAVQRIAKCTTWRKNVYGKKARALGQSFIAYKLINSKWTMIQSASGPAVTYQSAKEISLRLKCRAIWLAVSDVASWTGYYLFDRGRMRELLEDFIDHHGTAEHLPKDVLGSLKVESTGYGIFGAALRDVPLSKLRSPRRFIDAFFRAEKILAPISGEWNAEPGPRMLDLPYENPENIERLDFLSGGALATTEDDSAVARLRRLSPAYNRPRRQPRTIYDPSRRRYGPYIPPRMEDQLQAAKERLAKMFTKKLKRGRGKRAGE
jgi:hypothetical protein